MPFDKEKFKQAIFGAKLATHLVSSADPAKQKTIEHMRKLADELVDLMLEVLA